MVLPGICSANIMGTRSRHLSSWEIWRRVMKAVQARYESLPQDFRILLLWRNTHER